MGSFKPRSGVKNLSVLFADHRRHRRDSNTEKNWKAPSNADWKSLQMNLANYLRPLENHPQPIHIPDDLLKSLARKMARKMKIDSCYFKGTSDWIRKFKTNHFGSGKVFSEGRKVEKIYDIPMETGILVRQVLFKCNDDDDQSARKVRTADHQLARSVRTVDDDDDGDFSSIPMTDCDDVDLSFSIPAITLDELFPSNSTSPNHNNNGDANSLFDLSPISIVSGEYGEEGNLSCDLIERILDGATTDDELDQLLLGNCFLN